MGHADLEKLLAPALEEYGAALRAHGAKLNLETLEWRCECGWKPTRQGRNATRAIGLHAAAAYKRASKAYDKRADEILRGAR